MIIWSKKEGYRYEDESDGKRYAIFEMKCYGGKATSDCLAIWDEENDCFVNHVYGATHLDELLDDFEDTIKSYVDEYKQKTAKAKAQVKTHYPLTKAGVKAWCSDVVDDILDKEIFGDYIISHRNRQIRLPDLAEIHSLLEDFLAEAEEEANQ